MQPQKPEIHKTASGVTLYKYARLGSTNLKAKELLKITDISEGSVVVCEEQFAGRGYASNTWESEKGKNITASWILKPQFLAPHKQFSLTIILSLAVMRVVQHYYKGTLPVTIKWPNDMYVGNKKIAGILVENSIMGNDIASTIAGIGLNVNQEEFYSDAPNPISLKQLTGKEIPLTDCIDKLSDALSYYYNILRNQGTDQIAELYRSSLFGLNELREFKSVEGRFSGYIRGVDEFGRLQIENTDTNTVCFDFKEVSYYI